MKAANSKENSKKKKKKEMDKAVRVGTVSLSWDAEPEDDGRSLDGVGKHRQRTERPAKESYSP